MQDVIAKGVLLGCYVITVKGKDAINGMTASWVSQVSFEPKMLMVSIAPERYTNELIRESGYFAVNVLSEEQIELAKHYGFKSGRDADKFANVGYFDAPNGSPVLNSAMAYIECKTVSIFKAGDHELFVGEAVAAKVLQSDKQPLPFRWNDYF
ncbi:flavin reductase family protein [Candidatus Magnetobacterium casense]|uniref:Flavin reductase family protein n=1 Tax=Candidatus Magnetobacterium casense TaxID=1455061 RepID=A0ABS6RZZ7_9BACT|nr:flavin reductase family protein [Candidatus Magnetobacterium casensis]MBV6342185.1 flavin reductase family protein [Candidatus Magnetobacterium casensis]